MEIKQQQVVCPAQRWKEGWVVVEVRWAEGLHGLGRQLLSESQSNFIGSSQNKSFWKYIWENIVKLYRQNQSQKWKLMIQYEFFNFLQMPQCVVCQRASKSKGGDADTCKSRLMVFEAQFQLYLIRCVFKLHCSAAQTARAICRITLDRLRCNQ